MVVRRKNILFLEPKKEFLLGRELVFAQQKKPLKTICTGSNSVSRKFLSTNQEKTKSYWVRAGPKSNMTGVLIRRRRFGNTQMHTEGTGPCDAGSRDWNDAADGQGVTGLPATTGSWE